MDTANIETTNESESRDESSASAVSTPRIVSAVRGRSRLRRMRAAEKRQVIMKAMIPILAVALIVFLRYPIGGPSRAQAETIELPSVEPVEPDVVESAWEVPAVYEYTGRDPMEPISVYSAATETSTEAAMSALESFDVAGLLLSDDRPAAIIGTRIVHEGEVVGNAVITAIVREGVEFERNGQTWRQSVGGPAVLSSEETR